MRKCFVLEGEIAGFFASPRIVELHVHDDGTLSGSVGTREREDRDEETSEEFETFLVLYGTASPSQSDHDEGSYDVRFQLAKRTDLPGLVYLVNVTGTLASNSGLQGTWRFDGDSCVANARAFSLPMRRVRVEEVQTSQVHSLRPLTQGSYTFKGATVGDNGFLYQATWKLELLAGGELQGSSIELDNAPQISRLEGSWTSTGIHCTFYYQVDGTLGVYTYDGEAHDASLRGRCVNPDSPDSTRERGDFEYVLVDATRRWNHSDHKYYPKAFRDIVKLCLLTSTHCGAGSAGAVAATRTPRIPNHLWSEVFAYCGFDWFPPAQ